MAYQLYRETTLGVCLREVVEGLVEDGTLPRSLALRVLVAFDKAMNQALAYRTKNRLNFRADKLVAYRYCDNVWTLVMKGVEFRDVNRSVDGIVDTLKIVACDGRSSVVGPATGR